MRVGITGLRALSRLRQQSFMGDERLLADRGKQGLGGRKLLPDSAVATLMKPVKYWLYCFSLARMMVVVSACLRRRVLMMAPAMVTRWVARWVVSAVISVMLTTGLVLRNQRPAQ